MPRKLNNLLFIFFILLIIILLINSNVKKSDDPRQLSFYREITDSLLIKAILDYKIKVIKDDKIDSNEGISYSPIVAVYQIDDYHYYISPVVAISEIYLLPFSYFTVINDQPVLIYSLDIGFIEQSEYTPELLTYLKKYFIDDIEPGEVKDQYYYKSITGKEIKFHKQVYPSNLGVTYEPPCYQVVIFNKTLTIKTIEYGDWYVKYFWK